MFTFISKKNKVLFFFFFLTFGILVSLNIIENIKFNSRLEREFVQEFEVINQRLSHNKKIGYLTKKLPEFKNYILSKEQHYYHLTLLVKKLRYQSLIKNDDSSSLGIFFSERNILIFENNTHIPLDFFRKYDITPYETNNLSKPLIKFSKKEEKSIIQISPEKIEGESVIWISVIPYIDKYDKITWFFSDISQLSTVELNSKKILNLSEMGGVIFTTPSIFFKIFIKGLGFLMITILFSLLILKIKFKKDDETIPKFETSDDKKDSLISFSEMETDYSNKNESKIKKEEIFGFIHENFQKDISLVDLSEFLGCSEKYASILFRQITGKNFKDYLTNYRMNIANEIITSDKNIKIFELASIVGYNSSNSFIRAYKKIYGNSPKNSISNL